MATKPKSTEVKIPAIKIQVVDITLIGESSLVCHAFSEKARRMIEIGQDPDAPKPARKKREKEAEYKASMYKHPDGGYGFPTIAFKAAAVRAAKGVVGMTMVDTRCSFHVQGQLAKIKGKPNMREDAVRLKNGSADLRYRGEFAEWETTLSIRFNSAAISLEKLINLFNLAGFGVGVGEHRPEKGGSWGMFRIKQGDE